MGLELLLAWVLSAEVAGKYAVPRPTPWNVQCFRSSGLCTDLHAVANCSAAGMVCRNRNDGHIGCCCNKSQLFPPDQGKCEMDQHCILRCVEPKMVDGKPIFPRTCDTGTYCPLSSHGQPQVCATTLRPKKSKFRHCCGHADDSPEEQTEKGCCNNGVGIDCTDPHNRSCCLAATDSFVDPNAVGWCLHKCSRQTSCIFGYGFDCRSAAGKPRSKGRRHCCLRNKGTPSAHDHCQVRQVDCFNGYYDPCPLDKDGKETVGIDCSRSGKDPQDTCCVSNADTACRDSCDAYAWEQRGIYAGGTFAILCCALMLPRFSRFLKRKAHDCARSFLPMPVEVIVRGERVEAFIKYKDRYSFICTATGGAGGYRKLDHPNTDGARVERFVCRRGYKQSHHVQNATKSQFLDGLKFLVQQIQGKDSVLVFILLSGHGMQIYDSLFWAGQDAVKGVPDTHVNLRDVFRRLQLIHKCKNGRPGGDFDCEQICTRAHFVFFLDFCRTEIQDLSREGHDTSSRSSVFTDGNMAWISVVCAASSGNVALDSADASPHQSPFVQAFLENAQGDQSIESLLPDMQDTLEWSSGGRQRIDFKEYNPKAGRVRLFKSEDGSERQPLLENSSQGSTMAGSQQDSRPTSTESVVLP